MGAQLRWIFLIIRGFSYPAFDISTDCSISNGLNMRPQPFKVNIVPRNEPIRQAIIGEGEQALRDLAEFEGETQYRMSTFHKRE